LHLESRLERTVWWLEMTPSEPEAALPESNRVVERGRGRLGLKLLMALCSLLVGALLTEAGLRVVGAIRGIDYSLYMRELTNTDRLPRAMWSDQEFQPLAAGVKVLATTSDFSVIYQMNSDGWRDRERVLIKPAGVVRAIALGDSFTFGEGVDHGRRFSDIPESRFRNLEMLNLGVPGFGLDQALIALVYNGLKYSPDVVVLFLNFPLATRHNTDILHDGRLDLSRAQPRKQPSSASTFYLTREEAQRLGQSSFLLRHSKLLAYFRYQLTLRRMRKELQEQDQNFWRGPVERRMDDTKVVQGEDAAEYARLIIRKLLELGRANAFRLIVVNIDPSWEFPGARELEGEGLVYHSLQPELQAEAKRRRLRFVYDPHFTPDVHAFIGRRVAELLGRDLPALRE
jgi:hypothetical protein